MEKKPYLFVRDVAELLGCSTTHARKVIDELATRPVRCVDYSGKEVIIPWAASPEADFMTKKCIPYSLFIQTFPEVEKTFQLLEDEKKVDNPKK